MPSVVTGSARMFVLVSVTAALLVVGSLPAAALSPQIDDREPLIGGLVHERFTVGLGGGAVARGNVLRVDLSAEHLRVRPQLAQNRIAGLEQMLPLDQRARQNGALAGTNGGYWLQTPTGAPNGLYVEDGRVLSGEARLGSGNRRTRSAAGFLPDGDVLVDFIPTDVTVTVPGGSLEADDLNRSSRPNADAAGEVLIYDHRFGRPVDYPAGSLVVRLDRLDPRLGETASAGVRDIQRPSSPGSVTVGDGESVLLATGNKATSSPLTGLAAGDSVVVETDVRPEATSAEAWHAVADAVPGGPLIVRNGSRTSVDSWRREAFSDSHLTGRQPRTAIARTQAGEILLITVDGRQGAHSVGMTLIELAATAIAMGATDVLNLDGGGSTTMTVGGRIANRPSQTGRSIANGLFVFSDYPFDGSLRLAGADRYATAARIAQEGHPDGTAEAVIAVGEAFPDALAGGPLAAGDAAPLLLTRRDRLPEPTAAALGDLGVQRVTLLGGTSAVADGVKDALESLGIDVNRVSGADRYQTATAIAEHLTGGEGSERVFLAAGRNFPDALAAAPPAGALGAPVLLTEGDVLPEATQDYLGSGEVDEVVVVGGTSAVADSVADAAADAAGADLRRLAGDDRYATAAALNEWAAGELAAHDASGLVVAQGRDFPDALAGGPYAAAREQLLMIVPPGDVEGSSAAAAYLDGRAGALERVTLLGGPNVLSGYQHYQLDQYAVR